MIEFEHTEVLGWKHAVRGMRNPLNSWEKSDSEKLYDMSMIAQLLGGCSADDRTIEWLLHNAHPYFSIGPNDYDLMRRLRNAGTDHRKFMRMIVVYVDVTAPLYWWKEFDAYKVGTVANSCSTMHTIHKKPFDISDFSTEHLIEAEERVSEGTGDRIEPPNAIWLIYRTVQTLNQYRDLYLKTKDKKYWWQMIQLLPTSYNQKRTVMLNYEVLANIYKSRKDHKLDEWHEFCDWIRDLPYSELITGED